MKAARAHAKTLPRSQTIHIQRIELNGKQDQVDERNGELEWEDVGDVSGKLKHSAPDHTTLRRVAEAYEEARWI